ncbi:MAG: hypothetical protein FWG65_01250, partial [Turicibacter sp.]|nr:hypothetical protein [Turicibacter sp.]
MNPQKSRKNAVFTTIVVITAAAIGFLLTLLPIAAAIPPIDLTDKNAPSPRAWCFILLIPLGVVVGAILTNGDWLGVGISAAVATAIAAVIGNAIYASQHSLRCSCSEIAPRQGKNFALFVVFHDFPKYNPVPTVLVNIIATCTDCRTTRTISHGGKYAWHSATDIHDIPTNGQKHYCPRCNADFFSLEYAIQPIAPAHAA